MSSYKIVNGLRIDDGKLVFEVQYGPNNTKYERLSQSNKMAVAEFWLELEKRIKASRILKPVLAEAVEEKIGPDTSGSQVSGGTGSSEPGSSFFARDSEVEDGEDATSGGEDPEEEITNDSLASEIKKTYEVKRRAYISDSDD
ncbi:hypothetical protein AAVH_17867 [Aphelenchoides avenae]|nr:hypothetical protein AAVH_17867 [Aphelenchus avenae]